MLFVSVIPTAAFAGNYAISTFSGKALTGKLDKASAYQKQIDNMIKNTKANIETAYAVLVMDQVVYGSAKSMDDAAVGLVDAIATKLIEDGKMPKAFADVVKNNVRGILDVMVVNELGKNWYKYHDADGNIKPLEYAQAVADAVSKSLTDKDFQKGYEAVATYFALRQLASDVRDQLKEQFEAFGTDTVDAKFDEKFAERYPALSQFFVDSLNENGGFSTNADPWAAWVPAIVGSAS